MFPRTWTSRVNQSLWSRTPGKPQRPSLLLCRWGTAPRPRGRADGLPRGPGSGPAHSARALLPTRRARDRQRVSRPRPRPRRRQLLPLVEATSGGPPSRAPLLRVGGTDVDVKRGPAPHTHGEGPNPQPGTLLPGPPGTSVPANPPDGEGNGKRASDTKRKGISVPAVRSARAGTGLFRVSREGMKRPRRQKAQQQKQQSGLFPQQ